MTMMMGGMRNWATAPQSAAAAAARAVARSAGPDAGAALLGPVCPVPLTVRGITDGAAVVEGATVGAGDTVGASDAVGAGDASHSIQ